MGLWESFFLGVVEALTEFLPVSSTGHLILAGQLIDVQDPEFEKLFDIVIQSGAMCAILWHYKSLFIKTAKGFFNSQIADRRLVFQIVLAFLPSALSGVLFYKIIKQYLFGPAPVAIALIVGGIVMILVERCMSTDTQPKEITYKTAFLIGVAQCFSLWPGMSRSMSTILGGRFCGLSNWQAAEFSFWLAVPTLLGASVYASAKNITILQSSLTHLPILAFGTLVSFVFSLLVIQGFLRFLKKHSLEIFGWYRIVLGIVILIILR